MRVQPARYSWLALVGLACLLLVGCQAASLPPVSAQVGLAALAEPETVPIKGRLVPREYVTLSKPEGIRPVQIVVSEGEQVNAGDVLIRLEGYEQQAAQLAASELELVLARQGVDNLYQEAGVKLAETELSLVEASKELALAQDHFDSLSRPTPQWQIDQAYANLRLAENQLSKGRQDLEKAQRKFANKKNIIWRFINKRQFKLQITFLEQQVAHLERRFEDASEKYSDLLAGTDKIDLALAEARLATANANLQNLQRERQDLLNGPDPDALQAAQSHLKAAQVRVEADRIALRASELVAPIDGTVVQLNAKNGQWTSAGTPIAVLANLEEWKVETEDLDEMLVAQISPGQPVKIRLDAIPDLDLDGQVESIDLLYTEDDEEIYYTAQIRTGHTDPRLRWGMTARLDFGVGDQ